MSGIIAGNTLPAAIGQDDAGSGPAAQPVPASPTVSRGAWLAAVLKDRILNGFYQPGQRIREGELQKEFGFSNGPVREALKLTVAATLAESGAPWQGVRVVNLSPFEVGELFQLRTALLEYIAERAARFGSAQVLARGADLKARLADAFAGSGERSPSFGGELSAWLLDGADNAMLRDAWDGITLRSRIYVNDALRREGGIGSMRRLSALIDAVVARDAEGARRAARVLTQALLEELDVGTTL